MTKCTISTFVTKYSFYGILYPYSVRYNIRTVQPIFMKCWQELKQLINLVLHVFLLIANRKHACSDCQRKEISFNRQYSCHFIPIFSRTQPLNNSTYLREIFVLIRRSCVLCLTINFLALFLHRAAVFSTHAPQKTLGGTVLRLI